jgi:hypothetical protein
MVDTKDEPELIDAEGLGRLDYLLLLSAGRQEAEGVLGAGERL